MGLNVEISTRHAFDDVDGSFESGTNVLLGKRKSN